VFIKRSTIPCNVNTLFDYHERSGGLERLMPPWSGMNIISQKGGIKNDAITIFRINLGKPISFKWVAKHFGYIPNRQFQDQMIKGPFKKWIHTHSFIPQGSDQCILEDKIDYELKFGKISSKIFQKNIQNFLNQVFLYRHRILVNDLYFETIGLEQGKKILITGSHGLIGSALIPLLSNIGKHKITCLVRSNNSKYSSQSQAFKNIIFWDPAHNKLNHQELEGYDVIIHLGGENIFGRWTDIKKNKILDSRIKSTNLLSESLTKLSNPPSLLICASAIGYYGNRPNETLTEESSPAKGFLSEVCQQWENATKHASEIGIRVVNTRFGIVLTPKGGILQKLLEPFKFGVDITLGGNKDRYISWISIEDVIKSIFYSITNKAIRGAVNIVAPKPITYFEFSNILKKILNPKLSIQLNPNLTKLIFGQMSDELLYTNAYVIPEKLISTGYKFFNPELEDTLRLLLGRLELK